MSAERWGIEWHSKNQADGDRRNIQWEGGMPLLFLRRIDARDYIIHRFGYIKKHADLRCEPHGWRMPQAVRVTVELAQKKVAR